MTEFKEPNPRIEKQLVEAMLWRFSRMKFDAEAVVESSCALLADGTISPVVEAYKHRIWSIGKDANRLIEAIGDSARALQSILDAYKEI